jgi:predicted dithiol-disulfide oxidoreductase (DUF899 family)
MWKGRVDLSISRGVLRPITDGPTEPEESSMNDPAVVSRETWLAARKELLQQEKELSRRRDAVNAQRRRLPKVKVEKEYRFDGPAGKVGLVDLFDGRRQLIVYMFHPQWDEGCPNCSFLVDNIGHLAHLHARDT